MSNTLQAAACSLLAHHRQRVPLTTAQDNWVESICADPAFAEELPLGAGSLPPEADDEMRSAFDHQRRERQEILHLAREVVEDRALSGPVGDHTHDLGPVAVTTSLAAALVEFCVLMEGVAFDRGMAYGRKEAAEEGNR